MPLKSFLTSLLTALLCMSAAFGLSDDAGKVAPANKAPLLALKEVHPKTTALAQAVQEGKQVAPPGYALFSLPVIDQETNKVIGKTPILLSRRNIVSSDSVEVARAVPQQIGTVAVRLTKEGGKRVTNATQKMKLGVDRIAVVLEGNCLIAPTVQAVLGRDFVVNGLSGLEETKRIVHALNAPIIKAPKK